MKKEFKLSAMLDTAEFDRSIEQMAKKLKDVSNPIGPQNNATNQRLQGQGMGGLSGATMEAFNKSTQSARREVDQLISAQIKGQEKLGKMFSQGAETIKDLVKQQKALVQGSKEELEVREKIARSEANQQQLRAAYRQQDNNLNSLMDAKENLKPNELERLMTAYKGGGVGGAATAAGRMASQNPVGLGRLAGGIFTGIGAVASLAENVSGYNQRLQNAAGSAVENTAGQNLRDLYSGRSPFENNFIQERSSAQGLADTKTKWNKWTDRGKAIGGIGSAAWAGAELGAAGGAAFGGIGALPGAIGGALIGGTAAYFNSNDRTRQSVNPYAQDEYKKLLAGENAQEFRKSYEDIKNQDPGKKLALEDFEANNQRNVRSQRTLGLSNNQFYKGGGFLADVQQGGYMGEQGINMANSIVQAGGSSRMGGQARFGLDMERSGLTNASGILGTMSGSIQNPEANKRATISIMSEAFKIGLDNTTFAEENRKFTQAAANIIGRTGATSEGDQDKLSAALAQFMGQRTNAGVQEAQSAYERSQERGSQTSGRRGTLRFAAAMKNKNLSKMNTSDLTEFLSMRPEELNDSNPAAHEFASQAGFEDDKEGSALDKLKEARGSVDAAGRYTFPGQHEDINDAQGLIEKYMSDTHRSKEDIQDQARLGSKGNLPKNILQAMGRIGISSNKSESGGLTANNVMSSVAENLGSGGVPGISTEDAKAASRKSLSEGPGRIEDAYTKKAAEGADEARKNFNQLTESLWNTVKGVNALKDAVAPLAGSLGNAAQQNRSQLPQGNAFNTDITGIMGAQQQSQGNKPKGK